VPLEIGPGCVISYKKAQNLLCSSAKIKRLPGMRSILLNWFRTFEVMSD